jgi:hypothetical protein
VRTGEPIVASGAPRGAGSFSRHAPPVAGDDLGRGAAARGGGEPLLGPGGVAEPGGEGQRRRRPAERRGACDRGRALVDQAMLEAEPRGDRPDRAGVRVARDRLLDEQEGGPGLAAPAQAEREAQPVDGVDEPGRARARA